MQQKKHFAIGEISSIIHDIKLSAGSEQMLGDFKVEHSPMDDVRSIIQAAFNNSSSKNKRQAFRAVQRALNLAVARGYPYSEGFHYYFTHENEQSEMLTKKWLSGLFEYVSPDEFAQLSKLGL